MSQSVRDFEKSMLADNAITQFSVVKITTTGQSTVDVATANTDLIIGIAQNTAAAAEQVVVRFAGTSRCLAGGTITAGQTVTATTAGKVVADATDKHGVVGRAMEAAVTGDTFEVLLTPGAQLSA